jgi:hypothetical protein
MFTGSPNTGCYPMSMVNTVLILFNVKLFTGYYTITSKVIQSQGKLKLKKKCYQSQFMCNVNMVTENFTIFVTELLTFRGQVHT